MATTAIARRILMMTGMDAWSTEEEVWQVIIRTLGEDATGRVKVQPLGETATGKKTTTLKVTPDVAEKLLRLTHIKVVYNECYIRERVSIPKCYKCYECNHREINCPRPDGRMLCNICGGPNHSGTKCKTDPKFFSCKVKNGHRTGTMTCPVFRSIAMGKGKQRRKSSITVNRIPEPKKNKSKDVKRNNGSEHQSLNEQN